MMNFLSIFKNICSNFSKTDNSKSTSSSLPINQLPSDLILEVFSSLNLKDLGASCRVNKEWKQLASTPSLWRKAIYRELAFSTKNWAQYFGKEVIQNEDLQEELASLSKEIIKEYQRFPQKLFKKKAKESLILVRIPKTLNGELTLKSLGELAKQYFPSETGYKNTDQEFLHELGNQSIDKSRWVLMTKDILPESREQTYKVHQAMVKSIGYEIPDAVEASACILAHYLQTKKFLFPKSPIWTVIPCRQEILDDLVAIGGFSSEGFTILTLPNDYEDTSFVGVAGIKRF